MNFLKKFFDSPSSSANEEEKKKQDKEHIDAYNKSIFRLMEKDNENCQKLIVDAEQKSEADEVDLSRHALKKIPPYFMTDDSFKARIKSLSLDFNRFEEGLDFLDNFPSLQSFSIQYNGISELIIKTELSSLVYLNVSRNKIAAPSFLVHLPQLTLVDLSHNPIRKLYKEHWNNTKHIRNLNLTNCYLERIPSDVLENWTEMTKLILDCNLIRTLPEELGNVCKNLTSFSIQHNPLEVVPASFSSCSQLIELDLRSTHFPKYPDELAQIPSLQILILAFNKMKQFPESVAIYSHLTVLSVSGLEISTVSPNILQLTSLETLILKWNRLNPVPNVVFQMTWIKNLDLSGNEIECLPDSIGNMTNLKSLNLIFNKIKVLPPSIMKIGKKLEHFMIDTNPILDDESIAIRYETRSPAAFLISLFSESSNPNNNNVAPSNNNNNNNNNNNSNSSKISLSSNETLDKIRGVLWGGAVGDAIGLATEFLDRTQASLYYGPVPIQYSEMLKDRHRLRWIPGDWTDDTDQSILIMDNIIAHGGSINYVEFGQSLYRWMCEGYAEVGDRGGMGIGETVGTVLKYVDFLTKPHEAAEAVWLAKNKGAAANGAVMRTAILGILDYQDIKKVIENTKAICKVTHHDPRCEASCIAVTTAIALLLQGFTSVDWITEQAIVYAKANTSMTEDQQKEFESYVRSPTLRKLDLSHSKSIGYTFKSLGSAFWAFRQNDYAKAIHALMMEAGDADTNAVVAGALLGCKLGMAKIPSQWIQEMVHHDWLAARIAKFESTLKL